MDANEQGNLGIGTLLAQAKGNAKPQRLTPGEHVKNDDGTISTERSITIEDERLNGGRPTNIPTIWKLDKKFIELPEGDEGRDQAIDFAVQSGITFPSFNTIDEAVAAARARSDRGGRLSDQ